MSMLTEILVLGIILIIVIIIMCVVRWKRQKATQAERRATLETSREVFAEVKGRADNLSDKTDALSTRLDRLNNLLDLTSPHESGQGKRRDSKEGK